MNPLESASTRIDLLFDESRRIVTAAWPEAAAFVVLMTALVTALDQVSSGSQSGMGIVGLIAGYYLTRVMIVKAGFPGTETKRRVWPYIGLGLLSEIGISLGFLLLIVPGVVLGIRWLPAYGFLLAGGKGVIGSLKSSWAATRGHFMPLLVAAILPVTLLFGGPIMEVVATGDGGTTPLVVSLAGNFAMYCGITLWSGLGLATYSLLASEPRETQLAEVFS